MTEDYRKAFKEEARELLVELESSLLELEETPDDREIIGRVFRALHTIKGSGAMFGFDEMVAFTHEVETVFDLVRNQKLPITKNLVDLTLSAVDLIRSLVEASDVEGAVDEARVKDLVGAFRALIPSSRPRARKVQEVDVDSSQTVGKLFTYRIRFRPHRSMLKNGTNPILLLNELRGLGEYKVVAHLDAIETLKSLDPEVCYTSWDIILSTGRGLDAIQDVFIFCEEDCELDVEVIDGDYDPEDRQPYKKLGEILVEQGHLSREQLVEVLKGQKRIGELLVNAGLVEPRNVECALVEQQHIRGIRERRLKEEAASTVRVPADRLDVLVDLVGELVTVQARLSQTVISQNNTEMLSIAEEVERLTVELRDNTMSIRMLPIGTTFNKFKRLVRDLSCELGKQVELVTEGAETELDKTVIERLNDPLVHLIRNSIDHGIEPPDVRAAAGKPMQGTIHLSAMHSGASVLIRIRDDGAGLNVENIRAKALEKNLIAPDADLSEKEIASLIMAPGFSTASKVTNVSGRGVGMDVVKRSIDALRGSIDIGTERGAGTTITLKLPLTLAIIDGLLVKIGEGSFVLPLSIVEECVDLTEEDVAKAHGRDMTSVRGEIVPYIRLRDQFSIDGAPPEVQQIVITEAIGGKVGFVVDKVIGEYQTVIKTLSKIYRDVKGISGATILGDGTVALILDIPQLISSEESARQLHY